MQPRWKGYKASEVAGIELLKSFPPAAPNWIPPTPLLEEDITDTLTLPSLSHATKQWWTNWKDNQFDPDTDFSVPESISNDFFFDGMLPVEDVPLPSLSEGDESEQEREMHIAHHPDVVLDILPVDTLVAVRPSEEYYVANNNASVELFWLAKVVNTVGRNYHVQWFYRETRGSAKPVYVLNDDDLANERRDIIEAACILCHSFSLTLHHRLRNDTEMKIIRALGQ